MTTRPCQRMMTTRQDREIDAINEPNRPIPSGAISEEQVIQQIWALWLSGEQYHTPYQHTISSRPVT